MKILAIGTILLLISTLICGLWMRSQPQVDPSSITFHIWLGILSVLAGLGTSALAFMR